MFWDVSQNIWGSSSKTYPKKRCSTISPSLYWPLTLLISSLPLQFLSTSFSGSTTDRTSLSSSRQILLGKFEKWLWKKYHKFNHCFFAYFHGFCPFILRVYRCSVASKHFEIHKKMAEIWNACNTTVLKKKEGQFVLWTMPGFPLTHARKGYKAWNACRDLSPVGLSGEHSAIKR